MDEFGFTVFSISHFECEARWRAGHDQCFPFIEVRVFLDDRATDTPVETYVFSTASTLREIKRWTADYILQVIEEMKKTVRCYKESVCELS